MENLLLILTFSGVVTGEDTKYFAKKIFTQNIFVGVLLGLALRFYQLDAFYIDMIAYPGELFMRLLKLMILPLVIASLIAGSASLNAKVGANLHLA